jgi:anti-sigma regulatory factor (Ser/Thr protein kinase)
MIPTASPEVRRAAAPGVRLIGSVGQTKDFDHQCTLLGLCPRPTDAPDPETDDAGADSSPLLQAGEATIEAIRHSLSPPFCGFLETGPDGLAGTGPRCIETALAGGLVLSLTATTACTLPVVELAAVAIRRRLALPDGEGAELMEICLAEAVSNAVIHGNLEIPDHLRATPRGFESFRIVMRERLCNPSMALRRIEIHVLRATSSSFTLAVSDQGRGFNLEEQLKKETKASAHSGRGLGLIRRACAQIESEDGGRTLVMTFPWLRVAAED